jgi:hypothetical protein
MDNIKYRIKFVGDDVLVDYDGMNWYAAQEIGFDVPIAQNEIFINEETLTRPEIVSTIVHEIIEANQMRGGLHYWAAHKIAAEAEKNPENLDIVENYLNENNLFPNESSLDVEL